MDDKNLYLLVGPSGCGKSYYAKTILSHCNRVSQDDQGKVRHYELFVKYIHDKQPVVVDRMNFSVFQRSRYINYARQHGYQIHCVLFDIDRQACLSNLETRENHPTVKISDNHEQIVDFYFCHYENILSTEYDTLTVVKNDKYAKILDLRPIIGSSRFIVVGDIHGCFDEFIALLNKCEYKSGDFVISVGDLVDRGPKIRETLEWFKNTPNAYVVEGNHDNKAKRYWKGNNVKIKDGLDRTIHQCEDLDRTELVKWISSWPHIIQVPNVDGKPTYVVHGGIDAKYPVDRQRIDVCIYMRFVGENGFEKTHQCGRDVNIKGDDDYWYEKLDGSYHVLSGHIIHDDPRPAPYVWCLDGGAFKGKKLRALLVENNEWQLVEVDSDVHYVSTSKKEAKRDGSPIEVRDALVEEGWLRRSNLDDLSIYTYTDACTYDKKWDEITLNSRGIIFSRKTLEVVAQPFGKFFNMGEREETFEQNLPWDGGYRVFEKLDGWLGILYRHDGKFKIATRGTFDSDGAVWATKFLHNNYSLDGLDNEVTLVFELISPTTRIIVDYGSREDLVVLGAFNRFTGIEYDWEQVCFWAKQFGFTVAQSYGDDLESCKQMLITSPGSQVEGFVIRFNSGLRVKIKSEDYMRRASIRSFLTPLSVWNVMKNGEVDKSYVDAIDADYMGIFDNIYSVLRQKYCDILAEIESDYSKISNKTNDRKSFALLAKESGTKHLSAMFSLLDGQKERVGKYIMTKIRPDGNVLE